MKSKFLLFLILLVSTITSVYSQNRSLKETSSGWVKYNNNPVLGGKFGTIFDVSVLKEHEGYIMYCSWRPKKSIAVSESKDGLHWSDPQIVLGPDSATGWEDEVNRPIVVKRAGLYHMWYTGQVWSGGQNGSSRIGYATSKDGRHWKRMTAEPVLSAELSWEKAAVMCPHVLWDNEDKIYKM